MYALLSGSHSMRCSGTGTVSQEFLQMHDQQARQIGFFSYHVKYSLDRAGYGYAAMNYKGSKQGQSVAVDVSTFGSHLCLWLKGQTDSSLVVELFSSPNSASKWTVLLYQSEWKHYCLPLDELSTVKKNPVDLTQLLHVFITDVDSTSKAVERAFSVALISFAKDDTTYSVFPATVQPFSVVQTDATTGNCMNVQGPVPMAEVPTPQVPVERYTKISEFDYTGSER